MLNHEEKEALNTICEIYNTTRLFRSKTAITNIIFVTLGEKQATGIVLNRHPYTFTQNIKHKFIQDKPTQTPRDRLSNALDKLNLSYDYYPYETTLEITQTQDQLETYKEITETQPQDKRHKLGHHYDYPKYAVLNFHQTDPDTIRNYINSHTTLTLEQYENATPFTNYICPPDNQTINKTIEINKHRANLLKELDTQDHPNLHEFVQKQLNTYTPIPQDNKPPI